MSTSPWEWTSPLPGFCVTFVSEMTVHEMLACYGADPARAVMRTLQQTGEDYGEPREGGVLRAGNLGDWVFCQDEQADGSKPQILRNLSQAGDALNVFAGGDGTNTFSHFRRGELAVSFELGFPETVRGEDPQRFLSTIQALGASGRKGGESILSTHAALCAIGQLIGVDLDGSTVRGPLFTVFVPDAERIPHDPVQRQPATPTGRARGRLIT